jgi:hypothetical protein
MTRKEIMKRELIRKKLMAALAADRKEIRRAKWKR